MNVYMYACSKIGGARLYLDDKNKIIIIIIIIIYLIDSYRKKRQANLQSSPSLPPSFHEEMADQ